MGLSLHVILNSNLSSGIILGTNNSECFHSSNFNGIYNSPRKNSKSESCEEMIETVIKIVETSFFQKEKKSQNHSLCSLSCMMRNESTIVHQK